MEKISFEMKINPSRANPTNGQTQTIRRATAEELFDCVWPFFVVGAERVKWKLKYNAQLI